MNSKIQLFCPSCGHNFQHLVNFKGKILGGSGGAISGALLGAKFGIAGGPLGAIAGTIPGAVLGAIFGKDFGNKFDKPKCPSCFESFEIPNNLKTSFLNDYIEKERISENIIKEPTIKNIIEEDDEFKIKEKIYYQRKEEKQLYSCLSQEVIQSIKSDFNLNYESIIKVLMVKKRREMQKLYDNLSPEELKSYNALSEKSIKIKLWLSKNFLKLMNNSPSVKPIRGHTNYGGMSYEERMEGEELVRKIEIEEINSNATYTNYGDMSYEERMELEELARKIEIKYGIDL